MGTLISWRKKGFFNNNYWEYLLIARGTKAKVEIHLSCYIDNEFQMCCKTKYLNRVLDCFPFQWIKLDSIWEGHINRYVMKGLEIKDVSSEPYFLSLK